MKKIFIILSLLIFTGCTSKEIPTGKISCNQKEELLKQENIVIIDVRTKEEYKESHMENAINIPYDKLKEEINKKDINKDTPIIVYCKSGARSNKAYNTLIEEGYKKVYDLGALSKCNV